MKTLVSLLVLCLLPACSAAFFSKSPEAKQQVKSAVAWWCAQPQAIRLNERAAWDDALAPNKIRIDCDADPK